MKTRANCDKDKNKQTKKKNYDVINNIAFLSLIDNQNDAAANVDDVC